MSNTYREPTSEETEAYKKAINKAIREGNPKEGVLLTKNAIESVFGPCVYAGIDRVNCQVTRCTADEGGVLVRFLINCHLDRVSK